MTKPTTLNTLGQLLKFVIGSMFVIALINIIWRIARKIFTGSPMDWGSLLGWAIVFGGPIGCVGGLWEIAHRPLRVTAISGVVAGLGATLLMSPAVIADQGGPPGPMAYVVAAVIGPLVAVVMKKFKKEPSDITGSN